MRGGSADPREEQRDPSGQADTLVMPERLLLRMVEHLEQTFPNEGCGLIAFDGDRPVQVFPGSNVLASPTRYRMADIEVLRAVDEMHRNGWWLGAIYHSHPSSPPVPSTTDLREANWPDALMIIVSLMNGTPEPRAYRVDATTQEYEELEIEVEREQVGVIGSLRRWVEERAIGPATRRLPGRSIWQPVGLGFPEGFPSGALAPATGSEQIARGRDGYDDSTGDRPVLDDADLPTPRRAVIGILGGMGPLATADLYHKIIETTPASTDQEHIPVIIYADPRVPDRTEALLHGGEDPTPWLVRGARMLVEMGADFIVIPCNTAHAFLDDVAPAVEKPFLSMIDAAADDIRDTYPDASAVGLLATNGTIAAGIYQRALEDRGIEVILPDDDVQRRCVMAAIHEVKGGRGNGNATRLLVEAAEHLTDRGADVLLEACTEIPLALQQRHIETPIVDATMALAREAVDTARHLDTVAQWETSTTGWNLTDIHSRSAEAGGK